MGARKKQGKIEVILFKIGAFFALARLKFLEGFYSVHVKIRYPHDIAYKNVRTYKKYSDWGPSRAIHKGAVASFVVSFIVFNIAQSLFPYLFNPAKPREAFSANNAKTWTTQADFTGNASTTNTPTTLASNIEAANSLSLKGQADVFGNVSKISAGSTTSMAIKNDGSLWAWGFNGNGQFGNGTTTNSTVPVNAGIADVSRISSGWSHTLFTKTDGTAWGMGLNTSGQLGNGNNTNSSVPVQVSGLSSVSSVMAGGGYSAALKTDGTVWVWGNQSNLGISSSAPVQTALTGVTAISGGSLHMMALKSNGTVWTWGHNGYGQLGNGTTAAGGPVQVLSGAVAIAAGEYYSLALKSDGTVWAWGRNQVCYMGCYYDGSLGDGTYNNSTVPVRSLGLTSVVAISAGSSASRALKSDGTVWSWGEGVHTPAQTIGLANITDIDAGGYSLALKNDGTVWSWGGNTNGQLGNGTSAAQATPGSVLASVSTGQVFGTKIKAGLDHSVALQSDGLVLAWGNNGSGQLGNGTTTQSTMPVQVTGLSDVVDIGAGQQYSLALKSDGTVWAWGLGTVGQLGNGGTGNSLVPIQVPGLSGITAISTGYQFALAVKSDGTVWSWGNNGSGQLGNGTTTRSLVPVQATGLTGVVKASAGGGVPSSGNESSHALAVKSDGTVWSWGNNSVGQLGNNSTTNSSVPVQVSGLTNAIGVAAGVAHSLALKSDGTVKSWGRNYRSYTIWSITTEIYGMLGDGSTTQRNAPVSVAGITGATPSTKAVAIDVGSESSFALMENGTVLGWGNNAYSTLGSTAALNNVSPVLIAGADTITGIGSGSTSFHSGFVKNDGAIWTIGFNGQGQLGNPTMGIGGSSNVLKDVTTIRQYTYSSAIGTGFKVSVPSGALWAKIHWNGSAPNGTAIKFRTKGATDEAGLVTAEWSGYYISTGSTITTATSKWLEIEITLESDGSNTPVVNDFSIEYNYLRTPDNFKSYRATGDFTDSNKLNGGFTNETSVRVVSDLHEPIPVKNPIEAQFEIKTEDANWSGVEAAPPGVVATPESVDYSCAENPCQALNDKFIGTISGLTDGTYYYKVRQTDAAGIASDWSTVQTIIVDRQAPEVQSFEVWGNGDATMDPAKKFVNATRDGQLVKVALDLKDNISNSLQVQFSVDGANWGAYNGAINAMSNDWSDGSYKTVNDITTGFTTKTIQNAFKLEGDGAKTVYVRVRDGARNVGDSVQTEKTYSAQSYAWRNMSGTNMVYMNPATDARVGTYTVIGPANYNGYGTGLRFIVDVPRGTRVDSANLRLNSTSNFSNTTVNSKLSLEKVDNAAALPADSAAFYARYSNHTTAVTNWDNISGWTTGTAYTSPDIKTSVEEVLSRSGWSSGNAMMLFWEDFDQRTIGGNSLRSGNNPTLMLSVAEPITDTTVLDTQAPTIQASTLTGPNGAETWLGGATQNITWAQADIADPAGGTGLLANPITLSYSLNNGSSWTQIATDEANDGTYSWTLPAIDSAQAKIKISAADTAGNTSFDESNAAFIVDSTAPTGAANTLGTYKNTSTFDVPYSAADAGSGVESVELYYTANTASPYTWSKFGNTFNTSPISFNQAVVSGTYGFKIRAKDRVGLYDEAVPNTAAAPEQTVLVDLDAPGAVSVTSISQNPNNTGNQTISWAASPEVVSASSSGFLKYILQRKQEGAGDETYVQVGADVTLQATVNLADNANLVEGRYVYRVVIHDRAGNSTNGPDSAVLVVDKTAPVSLIAPTVSVNPNNTGNQTVTWTNFADNGTSSGFKEYQLQRKLGAGAYSTIRTETNQGAQSYADNSNLAEGTYYYRVVTVDNAGNSTNGTESVAHVVDKTAPTGTSTVISGPYGGPDLPWPGKISGGTSDAGGSGLSKVEIKVNIAGFYYDGTASNLWDGSPDAWLNATLVDNSWEYAIAKEAFSQFEDGSQYSLTVRSSDTAGNTETITSSFVLDTTPPNDGIFVIQSGNPAYTKNRLVTLFFSGVNNDVRTTGGLRISNDGVFDTETWENYNPVNPTRPAWQLAEGDGEKQVWIQWRDNAGNISVNTITDTIILDQTAAQVSINSISPKLNSLSEIAGTVTEAGSGISNANQIKIAITRGTEYWDGLVFQPGFDVLNLSNSAYWQAPSGFTGTSPSYSLTYNTLPNFVNGDYTIYVKAIDNIGNDVLMPTESSFRFDNAAPVATSLDSATHPDSNTNGTWYQNASPALSWSATDTETGNTDIVGYSYILDHNEGTSPDDELESDQSATTKNYSSLSDGSYWFHVKAKDGAGNFSSARHLKVNIDHTAPVEANPAFGASGASESAIKLVWGTFNDFEKSGIREYRIFRSTEKNTPASTQKDDPNLTPASYELSVTSPIPANGDSYEYMDEGLTKGWFYYKILAYDNAGNISAAEYSHSKTNYAPEIANFSVNGGTDTISAGPQEQKQLSVSYATTDADGRSDITKTEIYLLNRAQNEVLRIDQNDQRMQRVDIANGYNVTATFNLPNNLPLGNYTIFAQVEDVIVARSPKAKSTPLTIQVKSGAVQSLAAIGYTSTEIHLTWAAPAFTDGLRAENTYQVWMKEGDGEYQSRGTRVAVATEADPFVISGLSMSHNYTFKVVAYDVDDNLGAEATVQGTPPKPDAPTAAVVKDASHTSLDLGGSYPVRYVVSWDVVTTAQVPDLKGYKVYRSVDNLWEGTPIKESTNPNETYFTDAHVKADAARVYKYKVVTWDNSNNVGDPRETLSTNTSLTPEITEEPAIVEYGVSWVKLRWKSNQETKSLVQYKKKNETNYTNFAGDPRATTTLSGGNYINEITVKGLEKGTEYDFIVRSMSTADTLSANSSKISQKTQPFNIEFKPKEGGLTLGSSSAEIAWSTGDVNSEGYVEYKTGNATPKVVGTGKRDTKHSIELSDLTTGDYVFTLKNIDEENNVAISSLQSFTITGFDTGTISAPQAGKIEEKDITATSAKITWNSTVATTSWIDYGTTTGRYEMKTGNDTQTVSHVVNLEGLVPGTTYYYVVYGKDSNGTEYRSKEFTFVALAKPGISTVEISDVTPYSAKIRIEATKEVQASVTYGKSGLFDLKAGSSNMSRVHEVELKNLEDASSYALYVDVVDSIGNTAKSEQKGFATPLDTKGPEISEVKIDILPLGESDESAQAIISWQTNKPASTKIEYDEGVIGGKYSKSTVEDKSLNNSHTVIIKELTPSTTYHFRIASKDKRSNMANSKDYTFVTPTKEKSILQLIIRSLEETFSWTKNIGSFFKGMGQKATK